MTQWTYPEPAAYACNPYERVDVFARTQMNGNALPYVSCDRFARQLLHEAGGSCPGFAEYDLVPLQVALRAPSVDWSHVGPKINYIARDKDGGVWGYEKRPYTVDFMWCPSDGFTRNVTDTLASYDPGTVPWGQSLIARPKGKE